MLLFCLCCYSVYAAILFMLLFCLCCYSVILTRLFECARIGTTILASFALFFLARRLGICMWEATVRSCRAALALITPLLSLVPTSDRDHRGELTTFIHLLRLLTSPPVVTTPTTDCDHRGELTTFIHLLHLLTSPPAVTTPTRDASGWRGIVKHVQGRQCCAGTAASRPTRNLYQKTTTS
jgi:hypothetical protein